MCSDFVHIEFTQKLTGKVSGPETTAPWKWTVEFDCGCKGALNEQMNRESP